MNKILRLGLALAALLWLASNAAWAATIYKWVDDNGTIQFTAHPPTDRPAEKIRTSTGGTSASSPPASSATAEAEKQQALNLPPQSRKDPERCAWAKRNLETLKMHARIKIEDENGEIRFLNQNEISDKRQEAQQAVKESC